jgi:hypothetical protein
MRLADSERVLRSVTISVDSVGVRDLQTMCNDALLSCSVAVGGSDELAVIVEVRALGDGKMTSLAVGGLA